MDGCSVRLFLARMYSLDPRTIIFLGAIMAGSMALVLFFLQRNFPPSIQGLREWALSPFLLFLSAILAGARDQFPPLVSVVIPSMLSVASIYAGYLGSQRFFGVMPLVRRWLVWLPVIGTAIYWFTLVQPDFRVRLMLMSSVLGVLYTLHARLVYRHGARTFSTGLCLFTLLCAILIQLLRFATAWDSPPDTTIFDPSSSQLVFLAPISIVFQLLTISLILMASERLRLEFKHLAAHDPLTGAFTRRHMDEVVKQELERYRRHGQVMTLMIMDLDHFKRINDVHGHLIGDQVLVQFVAKVRGLLRRPDQLGRFGGEEFLLLLPQTPLQDALQVAERIRATLEQSTEAPPCTLSIGVTSSRHDSDTLDTMLARADAALYRAKEQGRNRVEAA